MNIILIASPAAGKGTQSELICNKYNLKHISTGDLLREVVALDNEKSREIKSLMEKGLLINDEIILGLIEDKLKDDEGFVFDGFPRNLTQAKKFDELLDRMNKKIDYVIHLKVDKEVALKRIVGRYVCPKCNAVYNKSEDETKICQSCGEDLIKRSDDNIDTFNNRYSVYMSETFPIVEYYENTNKLYEVDSSLEVNEVFKQIENILND